ncbi:hypothetical protein J2789_004459 [Variovorax paradoxus]|uniref:hypothetical protein n=1 Tax=Variovorax atrisoli TaxID=3394203 RepID=UPI00119ADD3C|nr:hypothetical protein [Variovorax paradoxus]MDR6521769.1 hypothetical protein [Variovorax paradoxus]
MYTRFETYVLRQADGAHIPLDPANSDFAAFTEWEVGGGQADQPPQLTLEQRKLALLAAVDAHLNTAARTKGYDSIISAALRAALPASPFHAEGVAFGTWMDLVYAKCYEVLAKVQSNEIAEPDEAQLIAMLPALQLPE